MLKVVTNPIVEGRPGLDRLWPVQVGPGFTMHKRRQVILAATAGEIVRFFFPALPFVCDQTTC